MIINFPFTLFNLAFPKSSSSAGKAHALENDFSEEIIDVHHPDLGLSLESINTVAKAISQTQIYCRKQQKKMQIAVCNKRIDGQPITIIFLRCLPQR